ncbi:NAD(P)-dependent oxidoreductase [Georgenia ruanii]|uniref:NAD(P)H-binding protein n=1 Tax=Georgenia ruanii TaxID=348442 RepID=A0A7J9V0U5_9MICO|nr:NAD(P)H-binding protein [Georgenia ruanii]MPV90501.1 NAD(P)H-binding protein [Georgenia ruanii]
MKIAVYGATGMIGREVVAEARRRGHEVTGFSRSGGDDVRRADLGDTATFRKVADEHEAVVISIPPDRTGGPHEPLLEAFDGVVSAGPHARVLAVVGAGSLEMDGVALADNPEFPEAYRPEAITMTKVLDRFRAADDLDWTAVSPAPMIQPGKRTGAYRTATDTPAGESISSQDLAVAIVDELEAPRHRRERFTAAN